MRKVRYSVVDIGLYLLNRAVDEEKELDYLKLTQLVYAVDKAFAVKYQDNNSDKQLQLIKDRIAIPELLRIIKKTYKYENVLYPFSFNRKIESYKTSDLRLDKDDKFVMEDNDYNIQKDFVDKLDKKDKELIDSIYDRYIVESHGSIFELLRQEK